MNTKVQPTAAMAQSAPTERREATRVPLGDLAPASFVSPSSDALTGLARECGKRGIILAVTENPDVEAALVDVYGRRVLVTPADEITEALDDLRGLGFCCRCHNKVDNTATPYYPGYQHLDGSPIMICPPCRTEQNRIAADPNRMAFSRCMDAIETVFKASRNPEMTRKALREFVDLTADAMKPGVPA